MKIKKSVLLAASFIMSMPLFAAEPDGYYKACEGKSGESLLKSLSSVISNHTNVGYDGLWSVYADSDVYPEDGLIWDMYSTKHWPLSSQRCGNYKSVGDCYNREHSMPKSWFSERSPMKSDAFHVYPTDGKVNGQRSNFPYGECADGTTLPGNGSVKALGRLGACTSPGYTGTVFEPVDEYKGDFARTYFYMAACYNSEIAGWSSPALAGNSYPAYKSWQIDVLLKWHLQDPVSDKETARNDAVEKHQHNRNPFIDHPELAEYIWGDKKGSAWSASLSSAPQLTLPVNGSAVNMGLCAVNVDRKAVVSVKGVNVSSSATVTVAGSGFAVSPTSLTASQINAGANVTVTFNSASAGRHTGTLTVKSGNLTSVVSLEAEAVAGLPAGPAIDVTDRSFVATWVCLDNASGVRYTLDVKRGDVSVAGYPRSVLAAAEEALVEGLDSSTTYTYIVRSNDLVSSPVSVTTGAPLPSVDILFDGDLSFVTDPGEPSDVAELLLDVENIIDDITLSVSAPFELSTDKSAWSRTVTLLAEEERFYLRLGEAAPGVYETSIVVTAADYHNDDAVAVATVRSLDPTFVEDFEAVWPEGTPPSNWGAYVTRTWQGSACTWNLSTVGMYGDAHTGSAAVRFSNKTGLSMLEMAEDKRNGIGTITFWAKGWKPTEGGQLDVEMSTDGGINWTDIGSADVDGSSDYEQYTITVNEPSPARIRFVRTSDAGRIRLDDITMSDYYSSALVPEVSYHLWDAYSRDGKLVVENNDSEPCDVTVYDLDGVARLTVTVDSGNAMFDLMPGFYIVVVDDFTRTVVVK